MELIKLSDQKARDHLRSLIEKPKMVKVFDQIYKKLLNSKFSSYLFVVVLDGEEAIAYSTRRIEYKNLQRFLDSNIEHDIESYTFNIINQINISRKGIEIKHILIDEERRYVRFSDVTNEKFLKHEIRKAKIENILKEI